MPPKFLLEFCLAPNSITSFFFYYIKKKRKIQISSLSLLSHISISSSSVKSATPYGHSSTSNSHGAND
nr:MAG TPA: hypothetical protein [Caudoviricetes sp.]